MKKAAWTVRKEAGRKIEWKDIRSFDTFEKADDWICGHCRKSGLPITDYGIAERKDGKGWTVRQRVGRKIEWKDIRSFDTFEKADDWICGHCRENGLPITDYTIARG